MKIDHLLHPELVLNRRGSKTVRSVYSELLNSIEILDDAGELRFYKDRLKLPYSIQLASFALANKPAMRAFEIWKRFKDHKGECFYLPKVFCNALRSVEKELVYEDFPQEFIGYFVLPKSMFKNSAGLDINGGYVRIHEPKREQSIESKRFLQMVFMVDVDSEDGSRIISQQMPLLPHKTLSDCIDDWSKTSKEIDPSLLGLMRDLSRIVVNAVLFIFHMDEGITALKPTGDRSNRDRKILKEKQNGMENSCSVPVQVISFDFHQNRSLSYSVESTDVIGYWRTQHWGPRRSQVKNVFINSHKRHFTTTLEIVEPALEDECDVRKSRL